MVNKLQNNIECIIAFIILVINFDHAIYSMEEYPVNIVFYLAQFFALVLLLSSKTCVIIRPKGFKVLFSAIFIVALIHGFNSMTYYYKLFLFLLLYQVIRKTNFYLLQQRIYTIMFFLASISILCYFLLNIVGLDLTFMQFSNEGEELYSTNFLYSYIAYWPSRNCSIYREPGIFQIYLNFALLCYYNVNKNVIFDKYIAVFIIALITTLSPAGILLGGAIVMLQVMSSKNISFFQYFMFAGLLIGAFIFINSMADTIFTKITSGPSENASAAARLYSLIVPLKICSEYPLFGVGALEFNTIIENYSLSTGHSMSTGSISNTLTTNFATSGLFVGLLYVVFFWKGVTKIICNVKRKLPYILITFALLFCENITYSLLFNLCLVIGTIEIKKKKIDYEICNTSNLS